MINMNEDLCAECGGILVKKTVTIDQHRGEEIVIFEDVPAEVCADCGEIWLSAEVFEKMEKKLNKDAPTRTKRVPVFSLAD